MCTRQGDGDLGFLLESCPLSVEKNLTLGTSPTVLPVYNGEREMRSLD